MSIIKDAKVYIAGYDLSGIHNEVSVNEPFEEVVGTRFGDTAKRTVAGLPTVTATGAGFVEGASLSPALRQNLAVANVPITIMNDAAGTAVEFFRAMIANYRTGAAYGQLLAFSWSASGQGEVLVPSLITVTGTKTTSGTSTPVQIGALSTGEKLYAALHVLAKSGTSPTLDVTVQSDNGVGFASPAVQGTFPQMTNVGSQWLTITGPITDDWWRASWTIGGTGSPSFDLVIVIGQ
jgi:hypothetical protein